MLRAQYRQYPLPPPTLTQITALGRAVRRRDIPTLKEIRADEREAAGEAVEVSKEGEHVHMCKLHCCCNHHQATRRWLLAWKLRLGVWK